MSVIRWKQSKYTHFTKDKCYQIKHDSQIVLTHFNLNHSNFSLVHVTNALILPLLFCKNKELSGRQVFTQYFEMSYLTRMTLVEEEWAWYLEVSYPLVVPVFLPTYFSIFLSQLAIIVLSCWALHLWLLSSNQDCNYS